MKKISTKIQSVGNSISGLGSKLTVGITAPLTLAGKSMVTAASDFDENLNKIDVAFGNSAETVEKWANDATKSFGLSMNQALEATSLFGDMATSMGLTQPVAAEMSMSLAGLAGDLASFKNINIEQAMTALNGVFTGETESLKQLGIVMTETNLQEFADRLGLVYDEMNQAEKVQLRYNYVMEMSKNAQGDYARTSDGTANSMRTFQASVENLSIALGQNLLPLVTPLIQKATEMVNIFANADPELQQLVLKIAGIAAVAGPALAIFGKITSGMGSMIGAIGTLSGKITALGGLKATFSAVFGAITSPIGIAVMAIGALVAAFAYLMTTNEGFRESVMSTVSTVAASLQPILETLMSLLLEIGGILLSTIGNVLQQLAPVLGQIVQLVGSLVAAIAPLVVQLIESLSPIITQIVTVISDIINSLMPPLIAIIEAVMAVVNALIPPIQRVLSVVVDVVSAVISAITPIIGIVTEIISGIIAVVSPIIEFVANVIAEIVNFVSPLVEIFAGIFEGVFSVVSSIFTEIGSFISEIFQGVQDAWSGLTSFVGGVFSGIGDAVSSLVNSVKGLVNGVIKGINGAIGIINMIPGVEIGKISYLLHGTDNWQGGFAYMNEGGRGELTYLPNGSQVIPHDISVKYAKEAARESKGAETMDLSGLMDGLIIQVINNTTVDGTPLRETISDYTIRKIGGQQRAVLRAQGVY